MDNALTQTKRCTGCSRTLPIDRFARKGTGRASRCKDCVSAYNRGHYERTAPTRRAQIARRKRELRAAMQSSINAARAVAVCGGCGASEPACLSGVHGPAGEMVRSERTRLLAAVLADPAWSCRRCTGRLAAERARGISKHPHAPTLEVLILDALHQGAQTVPEILAEVLAFRSTTAKSLHQALAVMARSGEIRRIARGRYAPQG